MTMLFNAHQLQIMASACGIQAEHHQLERFARLVEIVVDEQWYAEDCTGIPFEAVERAVAAEREECAKVCEETLDGIFWAEKTAKAIRARSTIPEQAPDTGAPPK